MAKNYSDKIQNASNKFFTGADSTQETHNTPSTHDTQKTQRTHNTDETEGKSYRINLKLDGDLEEFIKDEAWRQRTSVTQYLNGLIRDDKQKKQKA